MSQKILVGPINKGLRNDVTAFNIDNDSFPMMVNAYQWRGRIKRKRGTSPLGRLTRYFDSTSFAFNPGASYNVLALIDGVGNLLTGFPDTGIQTNASIVPGSSIINDQTAVQVYTDPGEDGILVGSLGGSGTITYSSGVFTIAGGGTNVINASFSYYPTLPVMGLEDLVLNPTENTGMIAFDTTYSYNISPASPYTIHDVSFYKNLPTATYTNYVQKSTWTPLKWNGEDYQQFGSVNYQGALWVTNGIEFPFTTTNIGMQYKAIVTVTVLTATTASLAITGHGLVVGDFVFINEVATTTGINFQTGYITTVTDANNVIVTFPNATLATNGTGGIAQYLTSSADTTKDGIRWYDGEPVSSAVPPVFSTGKGWVNFAPPLSNLDFSIADLPADQYYLAGARIIIAFKDRLMFVGPVVQTSASGSQRYLQDTVIYSQNGTPYYTASFAGAPLPSTTYNPILVPTNQTAQAVSFWGDQTGLGGWVSAGYQSSINTVSQNEDVLIMGFGDRQARFVYTGNDIVPFNFFVINSELGSGGTFSAINLDRGVITAGSRGFIITSQIEAKRFDLEIPDQIFQVELINNGAQRICAARDFVNEWMYFTYASNTNDYVFPTQTLQYNYRDQSWGLFNECYTTYGLFRKQTGYIWSTIGLVYPSWASWTNPWDSGASTLLQPEVIAGNPQGFVIIRSDGTNEAPSLAIQSFSGSTVTSPDHCLNEGDYILIENALGTISAEVNGKIFSVANPTDDTFVLNPTIGSGTYLGLGTIKRMYVPFVQSKQFPVAWDMAKKTRLGAQQYLLTTTANGQITLLIYLSQNASDPYNIGSIVPTSIPVPENNSLVYSTVLYTCPESTNLGLTAANTNLQMVTAPNQAQIWHRVSTSLIGDTIQVGFTMSDSQMRNTDFKNQFVEIEIHGFILDVSASMTLA